MPLYRPERFEEIRGHQKMIQFVRERIQQGTFPQFVIFNSEEGLGKTTLMKLIAMALNCTDHFKPCYECANCKEITEKVIRQNKDTQSVKTFKMSVEGGDAAAKEVIATFNSIIRPNQKRVIIMDEGHGMSKSAQDTLLQDTEYIPKDTYVFLATSEILGLKKQLVSRAVQFNLNRLPNKDLISLLKLEASRRHLTIQAEESAFELIVSWSENKARKALKVLEAMGEHAHITLDTVKDFIDFLDVSKVIPIISSLANGGSIIIGINAITDMTTDQTTHRSLIEILSEALKFSVGQKSFKLSNEDNKLLREAVEGVPTQRLAQFLYEVAAMRDSFSRQGLLAAYLKCHPMVNALAKPDEGVLRQEMQTKFATAPEEDLVRDNRSLAPSMMDLIMKGQVLDGGQ